VKTIDNNNKWVRISFAGKGDCFFGCFNHGITIYLIRLTHHFFGVIDPIESYDCQLLGTIIAYSQKPLFLHANPNKNQ